MSYSVSNWQHGRPKKYFRKCVELFGEPVFVANVRHGHALWKTKGLFTQHLLIDEDVRHCVPRPHHDYFYSSVRFFVPKNKVCDVLKISGSILYDGLKKELTARCGGIGANYATLYLGMLVASGKMSIGEAKRDDVYPRMIRGEIMPHSEMSTKMMALKRANNKKYEKELKNEFATYAYSKCYTLKKRQQKGGQTRKRVHKTEKLVNTRGEPCSKNNMSVCCPHMTPDERGRYAATTKKAEKRLNELRYRGRTYSLLTCCPMCAEQMNALSKRDPDAFDRLYKVKEEKNGDTLLLANRHTGKYVQKSVLLV